jgi:hypothetical protein
MVIVPLRGVVLELAVTEYDTVPFPVPELPDFIVTQLRVFDAVHLHELWVVIFTLSVPASLPKAALVESIE